MLLYEIIRYLKFLGIFGMIHPKFSRKFWNDFFINSYLISRKFRSHEIFWKCCDGRYSILSYLPGILGEETFGNHSLDFALQNSPGILGRDTLLGEITRDVKFLGNFGTAHSKFSRKF